MAGTVLWYTIRKWPSMREEHWEVTRSPGSFLVWWVDLLYLSSDAGIPSSCHWIHESIINPLKRRTLLLCLRWTNAKQAEKKKMLCPVRLRFADHSCSPGALSIFSSIDECCKPTGVISKKLLLLYPRIHLSRDQDIHNVVINHINLTGSEIS